MGFFTRCTEALLGLLTFAPVDKNPFQEPLTQQPLPLGDITIQPEHASPGFQCQYPAMKGWKSCNTPNDRGCWLEDPSSKQPLFSQYNIKTNYEESWPQGIHREYYIDVADATISPDGYLKTAGKVINGSYPGPLIEACWGDDITVHVTNSLKTNGTTIHWHGIRQLHTNQADGVNGVTQCPIATNDSYTYNFKATQYGHSWYHSHYSLQYPDGAAGPLLIHGPNSANWNEAWDPILISDWSHNSAFQDFQIELGIVPAKGPVTPGKEPPMQTNLLNGTGDFICDPAKDSKCLSPANRKPIFQKVFQKGKRYLLRLINASTGSDFIFTIDNHLLEVISTDFVPVKPFKNQSIHISIGQRYSVIVEADPSAPIQADGNYWIRTILSQGCGSIDQPKPEIGVIRYDSKSTGLPHSTEHKDLDISCSDVPLSLMEPIVPWAVDHQAVNDVNRDTYEAGLDTIPTHGYVRWDLTNTPLWLDFSDPTILNLHNTTFNPQYAVIDENYNRGYVFLIITSNQTENGIGKLPNVSVAHPIHMHGHDFVILGQSTAHYDEKETPKTFKYNNPPRRDVALLPAGGYLAIAFKPDNPGVWLVHCHIAWHASSGLALQILERQKEIVPTIGSLSATENTCKGWDTWIKANSINQDDSGI